VRARFGEHPTRGGGQGTVANFNHLFYARLFELLLRLKANYCWPAMWNNAFAEDDPDNARLADDYGIVMGSSTLSDSSPALPRFDSLNRQVSYIEVFDRGREPFTFTATTSAPWILLSRASGTVRDNLRLVTTTHTIGGAGYHTLKIWTIDSAIVLEKIVVNTSDAPLRPSYLGPEESYRGK
jgi:hypothetical protein